MQRVVIYATSGNYLALVTHKKNTEICATRGTPRTLLSVLHHILLPSSSYRAFAGIINYLWSKFEEYCEENNLKLEEIVGDGYCFINAVRKCLLYDFHEFHTVKGFQQIITRHLVDHFDQYTKWYGDPDELVYDATEFFNDRKKFNTDVVDVLVLATADALGLLIKIYRESPAGNIRLTEAGSKACKRVIHLKLSGTGGTASNPTYTGDQHYDALIIKFKNFPDVDTESDPFERCEKTDEPEEPTPSTSSGEPPSFFIDLTSPLKKRPRLESIEIDDFVDLTESPMKIPAASDTEMGGMSQSEDERGSIFSEFHANLDDITDELREDEETEVLEDEDPEIMETASSEKGHNVASNELDPESVKDIIQHYLRPSTVFPTFLFRNVTPKKCHFLPQNIDGHKYFKVKCTVKNYSKKTSDRRYFYMRTSSQTGLHGIRKIGSCRGSWQCVNTSCSFLKTEKKPNMWHFEYRGGSKACYSCGSYAQQVPCDARKMIQIPYVGEYAEVYHIGHHDCTLKAEVKSDVEYTRQWVERYPGISFKKLKSVVIQELIDSGAAEEAQNAAYRITTQAYHKIRRDMAPDADTEPVKAHSIRAVAHLKKTSDKIDPFHIFRINDGEMNNKPDFVMKSSSKILTVAMEMDQDAEKNPLQEEDAYFDGCHSRCADFISLGLWVQHPSMRCLLRLASMEVKTESTENVRLFFEMLNEMLQIVGKKDKNYKFNPKHIMCDEAGANIKGIKEALSLEYAATRIVTCQWHFMNSVNEKIHAIGEEDQEEFVKHAGDLCRVPTVPEFDLIFAAMKKIVLKYPLYGNSLDWYYARRYHLFPAFRHGLHSGLNLAEVGNRKWKPEHKLSLVAAAKDDISSMMEQETDLKRFNEGRTFKRGQVLTDKQRATQQKRKQMEEARSFAQLLENQEALRMQRESEENPEYFIPGDKARHKPSKKGKGVEGKTISAKGRSKGRGKGREPPTLDELLDKLNRAKRIESGEAAVEDVDEEPEEDVGLPKLGQSPEPRKVRPIKSTEQFPNPPWIVHALFNVSVCQGCPNRINSAARPPHDLFVRVKAIRPYQDPETLMFKDRVANGYLHLNLKCLEHFDKNIKIEDIRMTDEMFYNLSDAHFKVLADLGILKHIIANKGQEIQAS